MLRGWRHLRKLKLILKIYSLFSCFNSLSVVFVIPSYNSEISYFLTFLIVILISIGIFYGGKCAHSEIDGSQVLKKVHIYVTHALTRLYIIHEWPQKFPHAHVSQFPIPKIIIHLLASTWANFAYSRFHMSSHKNYSGPGFFPSTWYFWNPTMLFQLSVIHSFWLLSSCPLYECIMLFIHPPVDEYVECSQFEAIRYISF